VASTDGGLYAVDAKSTPESASAPPAIKWRFKATAALVSRPVISGDLVLAGGFDSRLHAVRTATGEEAWSFALPNWVWSQPLVDSGTVYLGDFDGNVYALN